MTTLVGIQGDGWAILGCDSMVNQEGKIYRLPEDYRKFTQTGKVVLGAAGDLLATNVIKTMTVPQPAAGADLDFFVQAELVPALRDSFQTSGIKKKAGVTVMAAVKGVIYEIGSDFEWCRDSSGYYAVGSGSSYALGALHAIGTKDFSAAQRALDVAISLDSGTTWPSWVAMQKSTGKLVLPDV